MDLGKGCLQAWLYPAGLDPSYLRPQSAGGHWVWTSRLQNVCRTRHVLRSLGQGYFLMRKLRSTENWQVPSCTDRSQIAPKTWFPSSRWGSPLLLSPIATVNKTGCSSQFHRLFPGKGKLPSTSLYAFILSPVKWDHNMNLRELLRG